MPLAGFGVAAVGLIAGGVTGAYTLAKADSANSHCVDGRCTRSAQADIDSGKTFGTISTMSFIVAGVGAAVGVTGILLAPSAPATPSDTPSAKMLLPGQIVWSGHF